MACFLLAMLSLSDVFVCRSTEIVSERPIAEIAAEAAVGLIHGQRELTEQVNVNPREVLANVAHAIAQDGLAVSVRCWRVLGFVLFDRAGAIEYRYEFEAGSVHVRRWARISNGRVQTTVTLSGHLGEPRVRSVTLRVEGEDETAGKTKLQLALTAAIQSHRIGHRIINRIAGRRLCSELRDLESAGREAVRSGENEITPILRRFLERRSK